MILATVIISKSGGYYAVWPCAKIESTLSDTSTLLSSYPGCAAYVNGTNLNELAIVKADLGGEGGANIGAALSMSFGMALWLSTAIHAIGVEVYVRSSVLLVSNRVANQISVASHTKRGATSATSQLPTTTRSRHAKPWLCRSDF